MDLEIHTGIGKFNIYNELDGPTGHEVYGYYKDDPVVGSIYFGSPTIDYYTSAEVQPNFLAWSNSVSLKRIQTGTTWDVQVKIMIGNGNWW